MAKEKKKIPTIKVCCGSKCKENKSGKVAKALEKEIAKSGIEDKVRVKKCDCLGKCKNSPAIEFSGGDLKFEGMKPKDAPKVIEKIAATL
jgi:NADH:ubiquinone oxidoreductase subunit E